MLLALTLIASSVGAASAQNSLRSGAKVNGLALGSGYETVIARLGKPNAVRDHKCDHGKAKGLEFDGLTVDFNLMHESDTEAVVTGFEIKSPVWDVSGVRVGDPESKIRLKFGKHDEESRSADGKTKSLFYLMKSADPIGNTAFYIKDGKISAIGTRYLILCNTSQ